jgi:hypothetical protein
MVRSSRAIGERRALRVFGLAHVDVDAPAAREHRAVCGLRLLDGARELGGLLDLSFA